MPFQVVKPEVVSKSGNHFEVGEIIHVDQLPVGASSGKGLERLVNMGMIRPLDDSEGIATLPGDADGWKVRAERAEESLAQLRTAGNSDPEAQKKLEEAKAEIERLQKVLEEERVSAKSAAQAHAMDLHNFSADPAKFVEEARKERDEVKRDLETAKETIGVHEASIKDLTKSLNEAKKANTALTKELQKTAKK